MNQIADRLTEISTRLRDIKSSEACQWGTLQSEFDAIASLLVETGQVSDAKKAREIATALNIGADDATWNESYVFDLAQQALVDLERNLIGESSWDCSQSPIIDQALLDDFLRESLEHLETAEVNLLALESDSGDPETLNAVFRAFHSIKGVAGFIGLRTLTSLAHESENILDRARENKLVLVGMPMDCIFQSVDAIKRLLITIQEEGVAGDRRLGSGVEGLLTRLRSVLAHGNACEAETAAVSEATLDLERAAVGASARGGNQSESIRVDRGRLDCLVDLIGELVIAESMVQQETKRAERDSGHVFRNMGQLNKITRNLQELSLSLRMVPVRATFQKMARLVRDLSKKLDKPIDFQMFGEETELDKTVVDALGDPLMHMIRNAVDHGIEATSADREMFGKPPRGRIELKAFHQGGNMFVEIHDDGRGLDPDRLRNKARQLGLISAETKLSDEEAQRLIFHPGFSTAEKVTDVSGRGVGMDVVWKNIESLRGTIDVRSTLGEGTCFSIRLPLTLAIIEGMAVCVGSERYVLPTLSIVELIRPKPGQIKTVREKGEYMQLRDEHIPLMRVDRLLGQSCSERKLEDQIIVVVDSTRKRAGLLVDAVLGQHQAVIKSLGHRLEEIPGVSGGAVMPDGCVGLILDIHGLLELTEPPLESDFAEMEEVA